MSANVLGMQELGNVTSADLVVYAKCEEIAPNSFRVMEFGDGEGLTPDSKERAVTRMGIDGKFVYGIVFRASQITVTCLPGSEFLRLVDQCNGISIARRKGLKWSFEVTYPAIGKHYSYKEGIITNAPDMAAAQETLGNVAIQFQFGSCEVQNIGEDEY